MFDGWTNPVLTGHCSNLLIVVSRVSKQNSDFSFVAVAERWCDLHIVFSGRGDVEIVIPNSSVTEGLLLNVQLLPDGTLLELAFVRAEPDEFLAVLEADARTEQFAREVSEDVSLTASLFLSYWDSRID